MASALIRMIITSLWRGMDPLTRTVNTQYSCVITYTFKCYFWSIWPFGQTQRNWWVCKKLDMSLCELIFNNKDAATVVVSRSDSARSFIRAYFSWIYPDCEYMRCEKPTPTCSVQDYTTTVHLWIHTCYISYIILKQKGENPMFVCRTQCFVSWHALVQQTRTRGLSFSKRFDMRPGIIKMCTIK